MKIIKTSQELYEHVMSEYKKYDTELNSLFFDFPVHMSKSDILVTYEHLQHDINGDYIVKLKNPKQKILDNEDIIIYGDSEESLAAEYDEVYDGNCKDFLESFNDRELETGICRVDEFLVIENFNPETQKCKVGGVKFDFIA